MNSNALRTDELYTLDDIKALPEGTRAELIDGDMYRIASPVRVNVNGQIVEAFLSRQSGIRVCLGARVRVRYSPATMKGEIITVSFS